MQEKPLITVKKTEKRGVFCLVSKKVVSLATKRNTIKRRVRAACRALGAEQILVRVVRNGVFSYHTLYDTIKKALR